MTPNNLTQPPSDRLERTAFVTSRTMDFFSLKDLEAQTGHAVEEWPLVVVKELMDNALDAAEEAGIAPIIAVTVNQSGITVADNGPGIPEKVIQSIGDFDNRVSSRDAYVAPDRGKQGNALKTLLAMPLALGGEKGTLVIASHGKVYRLDVRVDQVRQQAVVNLSSEPADVKNRHFVKVEWPNSASQLLASSKECFLQTVENYALLNPHLGVTLDWLGQRVVDKQASDPAWPKWKPCNPTSPHWYTAADLGRLIGAYIKHAGTGSVLSTREFIAEFRGLAGTSKQKHVTDACGLTEATLTDLIVEDNLDTTKVSALLEAMRQHSTPVKPAALGIIGRDHLYRSLAGTGCEMGTFHYRKIEGTCDGVPWIVEAAFAARADGQDERLLATGVNWSPAVADPFRTLSDGRSLAELVAEQRAGAETPVVLVLHVACARVTYTDRGKSAVRLPDPVSKAIIDAVTHVTAAWSKQMKAEERKADARARRWERMMRQGRPSISQRDAAFQVMEQAYLAASANGTLPAHARQIMYQARPLMQKILGKTLDGGFDEYFSQTLLPDFVAKNPKSKDWDIVYDARGHLVEPHTGRIIPLGTLPVRNYLAAIQDATPPSPSQEMLNPCVYPTYGPRNRFRAILFIEKEGFMPLFEKVKLRERFDLAIMSTKGMSVMACRWLVDQLGIPVLILHDFDKSGFSIASTLRRDTQRYQFANHDIRFIDLGLRLADVTTYRLAAEDVSYGNKSKSDPRANLVENGATTEEIAFLYHGYDPERGHHGRRVELNAFTSAAMIQWIEGKLVEHGIGKTVPDLKTLDHAYRRAVEINHINLHSRQVAEDAAAHAAKVTVPADLEARVEAMLRVAPAIPWDHAIGRIVADDLAVKGNK